jgi:hypothetical protein
VRVVLIAGIIELHFDVKGKGATKKEYLQVFGSWLGGL